MTLIGQLMKGEAKLVLFVVLVRRNRLESSFLSFVGTRSSSNEKGTSISTKISRALHRNLSLVLYCNSKDTVKLELWMIRDNDAVSRIVSSMMIEMLVIVDVILEGNHGSNTVCINVAMVVKVEENSVSARVFVQVEVSPGK